MKARFSLPTRLSWQLLHARKGQAMVEMALIAPALLVLVAGVGDLGRAFYYKIAVSNAAREAAHWATLADPTTQLPPTDSQILNDIASKSQESFGICMEQGTGTGPCPGNGGLAPDSVRNTQPGTAGFTPQLLANPGNDQNLSPSQSYLYIYPSASGRTSLAPGMHWQEVASSSRIVTGPLPKDGGLATVLHDLAGSLYPVTAYASSCYTWTGVSLSQTAFTTSTTPPYSVSLTATLTGISGSSNATNSANFTVNQVGVPSFQTTWTPTGGPTGSIDPQHDSSDSLVMTHTLSAVAGTYTYQVQVTSLGSCPQPVVTKNFTVTIPPGPSPSPAPSASPTASPSASPSSSPSATPSSGSGPGPLGRQITCTVIYYFQPVTPLIFVTGQAVYVVGTATLQATY